MSEVFFIIIKNSLFPASFIFTLHLAEKWQRHPAADLKGYKPLLQFTIFSSNKSVNHFYLKMKDAPFSFRKPE
ncbi:MAG: hypothetical protein DRH24_05315 [Deltaproteobacteria bacterium]|nr:MAG: hypothetical protein DRH24_05315 [Deltaproteobacteria bacterium]